VRKPVLKPLYKGVLLMNNFRYGRRSERHLAKVKPILAKCARVALKESSIDFGVVSSIRTVAEQRKLVESGASMTMRSKHLTGDAIDLVCFVGGKATYSTEVYYDMIDAFQIAAIRHNILLVSGAHWMDLRYCGDNRKAVEAYVERKRRGGGKPFLDFMHIQVGM